jgi:hypothetical protein
MTIIVRINIFCVKWRQVNMEWGVSRKEGKSKRESLDLGRERWSIGENRKWCGLRKVTVGKDT